MKTQAIYLSLAVELSNTDLNTARSPQKIIDQVAVILDKFSKSLGNFLGMEEMNLREIGHLFANKTYVFKFGHHEVTFNLLFFQPADRWELKNFQLIAA